MTGLGNVTYHIGIDSDASSFLCRNVILLVGLGLEGQVVKFIVITNFFSYTYYTDHKNGYSRPESRNLD